MKIKMILCDMDGTLLNDKQEISAYTKEVLIKAQKQGVILVLASGRSYKTLVKYGKELQMDQYNGYFICSNGAVLSDATLNNINYLKQFEVPEIKELYNFIKPFEVEMMAVQDSSLQAYIPNSLIKLKKQYISDNNLDPTTPLTGGTFNLVYDQRKNYTDIKIINEEADFNKKANKVVISHNQEIISKIVPLLIERFKKDYNFNKTSPTWIEVAPLNISKGNTLLILADKYKINTDEIMVFGDGENDLSMMKVVKYSVAMANAMPLVKQTALLTTLSNNEDGIAVMVEKEIINKKEKEV